MNYYFYKLIAPRKTFASDMTSAEAAIMAKHTDYWKALIGFGQAVLAGPVDDPHGSYGVGIVKVQWPFWTTWQPRAWATTTRRSWPRLASSLKSIGCHRYCCPRQSKGSFRD